MVEREKVAQLVYSAVAAVNQTLPKQQRLVLSDNSALTGETAVLDSLALISLIVAVEQEVHDALHASISLTDDLIASGGISPFESIGELIERVSMLIEKKQNEE